MFTLNELQSGINLSGTVVKCQFGNSKIISFNVQVLPNVSNLSKLFFIENPKYWELKDDCTNEQFCIFINLLIKDLLIYKGLVSL